MENNKLYNYILEIADNNLILGHRLSELCGHGPSLETDIACTNVSLDLFGQVRNYYQYAGEISNKTEDEIAFLRIENQYKNVLLVEQPNTNFAFSIVRQFLFDVYHFLFLTELQNSTDKQLVAIANKSIKEVSYHKRFSSDWIIRLGDGTQESNSKIQEAIDDLWTYTNELFEVTENTKSLIEQGIAVDTSKLKKQYYTLVNEVLTEATISIPESKYFQKGGKSGVHTEYLGFILAELQYMQRAYPNMEW